MVSEQALVAAATREEVILEYLKIAHPTRRDAEHAASLLELGATRFYQLLAAYRANPSAFALMPKPKDGGRGKGRLGEERESICHEALDQEFLGKPHALIGHAVRKARAECHQKGVALVSKSTVYRRAAKIDQYVVIGRKQGWKEAREQFSPRKGQTPPAARPLQQVQIDHTRWPCQIVDEEFRKPIGRPYLTIILDEYSRCVLGFFFSLSAPSSAGLARAIIRAVLPKEDWLKSLGLEKYEWPVYGKFVVAYLDNAQEFVTAVLKTACIKNGIQPPKHRPKDTPNFGGYIEAMMKSAQIDARTIPGSTGAKPKEAGRRHKPEDFAAMTLRETEWWFTHWLITHYHTSPHSGLDGARPIDLWNLGVHGDDDELGIGPPEIVKNPRAFELDFSPSEWRVIRREGVRYENDWYMGEVLYPFIYRGEKKKYLFKIDPTDARTIYFLHPETGEYFPLHCARRDAPHITLSEKQELRRLRREKNLANYDEAAQLQAEQERDKFVKKATSDTKNAKQARRRAEQKREAIRRKEEAARLPTDQPQDVQGLIAANEDDFDDGRALPILEWQP